MNEAKFYRDLATVMEAVERFFEENHISATVADNGYISSSLTGLYVQYTDDSPRIPIWESK